MSATDFGDPYQIIHIPARDLTGTREAKLAELELLLALQQKVRLVHLEGFLGTASHRVPHRSQLWSWVAVSLRDVCGTFAHGTADTKSERS